MRRCKESRSLRNVGLGVVLATAVLAAPAPAHARTPEVPGLVGPLQPPATTAPTPAPAPAPQPPPAQAPGDSAVYETTPEGTRAAGDGGVSGPLRRLWSRDVRNELNPPLIADGIVVASTRGSILALDARTGRQRWRVELGSAFRGSQLAIEGGVVVAVVPGADVHGLS